METFKKMKLWLGWCPRGEYKTAYEFEQDMRFRPAAQVASPKETSKSGMIAGVMLGALFVVADFAVALIGSGSISGAVKAFGVLDAFYIMLACITGGAIFGILYNIIPSDTPVLKALIFALPIVVAIPYLMFARTGLIPPNILPAALIGGVITGYLLGKSYETAGELVK